MRTRLGMLAVAALVINYGVASAQTQAPTTRFDSGPPTASQSSTPDRSPPATLPEANTRPPETTGAPVSETVGQGTKFEDRWSAQRERPPAATPPETTGETPSMSKKMGPEMDSVGDQRPSPDDQ